MGLLAFELGILAELIATSANEIGRKPRVLLLGYPDIICTPASLKAVGFDLQWEKLPKRSVQDSERMWQDHGRPHLSDIPMLNGKDTISALGAIPFVIDKLEYGKEDAVLDLNEPVEVDHMDLFDLIVDPGTLEHCFNIAQAFDNMDRLLNIRGFIYHQAAAAFPNHGFYSISPTAFYDFYQSRGFELGTAYYWHWREMRDRLLPELKRIYPFKLSPGPTQPRTASYIFRKGIQYAEHKKGEYPIQRCYSSLARDIKLVNFFPKNVTESIMPSEEGLT